MHVYHPYIYDTMLHWLCNKIFISVIWWALKAFLTLLDICCIFYVFLCMGNVIKIGPQTQETFFKGDKLFKCLIPFCQVSDIWSFENAFINCLLSPYKDFMGWFRTKYIFWRIFSKGNFVIYFGMSLCVAYIDWLLCLLNTQCQIFHACSGQMFCLETVKVIGMNLIRG